MLTMPEGDAAVSEPDPVGGSVRRQPRQGRSRASLDRMLAAARELMMERASEEFTLQEVSRRGRVSIGSIYLRFDGKDSLVRAVIAEGLAENAAEEGAMYERLRRECATLAEFVPAHVEAYAEILRTHAPLLRLGMKRAVSDPLVAAPGKQRALSAEQACIEALLRYEAEFGGSDHETKASSAHHVIYATLARQLSLGAAGETAIESDWNQLKRELARMCLAYLRFA